MKRRLKGLQKASDNTRRMDGYLCQIVYDLEKKEVLGLWHFSNNDRFYQLNYLTVTDTDEFLSVRELREKVNYALDMYDEYLRACKDLGFEG